MQTKIDSQLSIAHLKVDGIVCSAVSNGVGRAIHMPALHAGEVRSQAPNLPAQEGQHGIRGAPDAQDLVYD
eukprot:10441146-Lingulodinium_polyedra.AAC.1